MLKPILKVCALLLPIWFNLPVAAEETVDAAMIYAESCSVCHGDDGRGAVWGQASLATPPRNFRTDESQRELTRERMIASATYGRPGTPMPGFGTQLSVPEITAVVDYIRENFMRPATKVQADPHGAGARGNPGYGPAGGHVAIQEAPDSYEGNAVRGAELYTANCADCHGLGGAGDGPRAYFIFPKPRNFHDPATRQYLSRRNLYNGIKFGVVGKEMPAWGKVWSDQEIADVAEYVYGQFVAAGSDGAH
jgi:mono/diheme cytochrome c family protein